MENDEELRIPSEHLGPAGGARPELTPSVFLSPVGPWANPAQRNKGPGNYGAQAQGIMGPTGESLLPSLNVPSSAGLRADFN